MLSKNPNLWTTLYTHGIIDSSMIPQEIADAETDVPFFNNKCDEQKRYNDMNKENKIILYKDDDGKVSVNTRFADEDVWLTQAQLVEIYQSSKSNISEHLTNIFADKELEQDAVVRKFRTTATDGKNYQVMHYNLDVVIALGYRVQSPIAVRFRRWATQRLHEYIQKGFTMDDERL